MPGRGRDVPAVGHGSRQTVKVAAFFVESLPRVGSCHQVDVLALTRDPAARFDDLLLGRAAFEAVLLLGDQLVERVLGAGVWARLVGDCCSVVEESSDPVVYVVGN